MVTGISGGQGGPDMSALWQELLKRADKDGDSKISREEFDSARPKDRGRAHDNLFSRIDTNADGFIDESENAAVLKSVPKGRPPGGGMNLMKLFEKADSDGDGQISKTDFQSAASQSTDSATAGQIFDAMDTNQDGVVSVAEYIAAMQKLEPPGQSSPPQGLSTLA